MAVVCRGVSRSPGHQLSWCLQKMVLLERGSPCLWGSVGGTIIPVQAPLAVHILHLEALIPFHSDRDDLETCSIRYFGPCSALTILEGRELGWILLSTQQVVSCPG